MKDLLLFILIALLILIGCAVPCPSRDVIYGGSCGNVFMPKGYFGDENRGSYWVPFEEYDEIRERVLRERGDGI